MSGPDGEFDDFLARRKPLFRRPEDVLEPPSELDRLVLRQAREAIRRESPEPAYHGTRWGMPVALAATVLVATTILLNVGLPHREPVPQVTVQNVTQRVESMSAPAPVAAPAPQATETNDASHTLAKAAPSAARSRIAAPAEAEVSLPAAAPAVASDTAAGATAPDWRRDARTWLAAIDALRAEGKTAQADAEMAEFKRQNRAYAVSPDR